MDRKEKLQQAAQLGKSGDVEGALTVLYEVIDHNHDDKAAWWGVAATSTDPLEKRRAVNQILRIDPTHAKALDLQLKLDAAGVPSSGLAPADTPDLPAMDDADPADADPDTEAMMQTMLDVPDTPTPPPDTALEDYAEPSLQGTQDISDELSDLLPPDMDLTAEGGDDWLGGADMDGELELVDAGVSETFDDWLHVADEDDDAPDVPAWLEESSAEIRVAEVEHEAELDMDAPPLDWLNDDADGLGSTGSADSADGTDGDDGDDAFSTTDLKEFLPLDDDPQQISALPAAPQLDDDAEMADWMEALGNVADEFEALDASDLGLDAQDPTLMGVRLENDETVLPSDVDFGLMMETDDADNASAWMTALGDDDDLAATVIDADEDWRTPDDAATDVSVDADLLGPEDLAEMVADMDVDEDEDETLLLTDEMRDSGWLQDYAAALEDLESPQADIDLYDGVQRPDADRLHDEPLPTDALPVEVPRGVDGFDDAFDDGLGAALSADVEDFLNETEGEIDTTQAALRAMTDSDFDDDDDELALLADRLLHDDDAPAIMPEPSRQATHADDSDVTPETDTAAPSVHASSATTPPLDPPPLDPPPPPLQLPEVPTEPPAPPLRQTPPPAASANLSTGAASEDDLDEAMDTYLPDAVRDFHNTVENIWERDLAEVEPADNDDMPDIVPQLAATQPSAPVVDPSAETRAMQPQTASVVRYEDVEQQVGAQQKPSSWLDDPEKAVQVAARAAVGLVVLRFVFRALFGRNRH